MVHRFSRFNVGAHVSETAEFDYRFPVHLGIDSGVSRFVGAVWFQVRQVDQYRHKVTVFADHLSEGMYQEEAANSDPQTRTKVSEPRTVSTRRRSILRAQLERGSDLAPIPSSSGFSEVAS